jgi:hypothetical protein
LFSLKLQTFTDQKIIHEEKDEEDNFRNGGTEFSGDEDEENLVKKS